VRFVNLVGKVGDLKVGESNFLQNLLWYIIMGKLKHEKRDKAGIEKGDV
jgi:hypothetical protein